MLPTQPELSPSEKARIIDEYGDLEQKVKAFKPTKDRYELLSRQIASWFDAHPPELAVIAEGNRFTAQISARSMKRRLFNTAGLYRILGRPKFLMFAKVNLEDIDKHVPADQHSQFLDTSRSGARRVEAVAKSSVVSINSGRRKAA